MCLANLDGFERQENFPVSHDLMTIDINFQKMMLDEQINKE